MFPKLRKREIQAEIKVGHEEREKINQLHNRNTKRCMNKIKKREKTRHFLLLNL